ncbi:hypothetical protein [Mycolicibacterium sp. lyk4-40-TYG-92]|jgi:uncharacterized membrane protein|uniref:hypothetical protein n=1 Tax=Mycolicibacterium sp. lyk4-40-TYG-92 TaxID=3040295 RepID=UPI00254E570C|nr:hypothetical protein [Mycolicibacterium sp. lyk4-40-TYG-92]
MSPIRRGRAPRLSIYTPGFRRERRRRAAGWLLVGVGAVMALVHMVTHLGRFALVGYQDLLMGYPMAAVLILAGFILIGWVSTPSP